MLEFLLEKEKNHCIKGIVWMQVSVTAEIKE